MPAVSLQRVARSILARLKLASRRRTLLKLVVLHRCVTKHFSYADVEIQRMTNMRAPLFRLHGLP